MMSRRIIGQTGFSDTRPVMFKSGSRTAMTQDDHPWPRKRNCRELEKTFVRGPNIVYTHCMSSRAHRLVPEPRACWPRALETGNRFPLTSLDIRQEAQVLHDRNQNRACRIGPQRPLGLGALRGGDDGEMLRVHDSRSAGIAGRTLPSNGQSALFCSPRT
jgi:hypothetical protein